MMVTPKPTKERVKQALEEIDALNLPDDLHWTIVHKKLGVKDGEVFEIIAKDMAFFGCKQL